MKSYNIDLNDIHVNFVVFFFISYRFISLSLYFETYHFNHTFTYSLTYLSTIITGIVLYLSLLFSSSTNNKFPWAFLCFFQRFLVCLCAYFLFYFFVICACTGSSPSSSYKVTHSKNNICIINISTQAAILVESAFGKKIGMYHFLDLFLN